MNRILLHSHWQIDHDLYKVESPAILTHLHQTLKSQSGDQLKVVILDQTLALAQITELNLKSALLKITAKEVGLPSWCTLEVGLSRPLTMKKVLEHGSCMGVGKFYFFKAQLSEKSYASSQLWQNDEYQRFLEQGLCQSAVYYQNPQVQLVTRPQELEGQRKGKKIVLVNSKNFPSLQTQDLETPLHLVLGPERGLTQEEEDYYISSGHTPLSLGPAVLRVEYAMAWALAQCQLRLKIK